MSQESNSVTTEILDEVDSNSEFGGGLSMTLGCHSLNALYKKFEDFWVVHALDHLAVDLTEHKVSLLVLERVVQARLGALLQALDKRSNLIHLSIRYFEHVTTVEGVNQGTVLRARNPLTLDKVEALVFCRKIGRVDCCKCFQVLRDTTELH